MLIMNKKIENDSREIGTMKKKNQIKISELKNNLKFKKIHWIGSTAEWK